eukprot:gnl/TRDRNA2_/TRDRNA2_195523_c0_seq1.p1 gnl/TRDRNA2_/TRDRNA2_195523_c0~~gnl/TRDRNA2_/TRDRNA2_195523_c0_seq1.p1  ORF type:complete len:181 (+),score=45.43 gnl/TRDRNA2_/TRDRNA2_195523_c0_seq1:65-544(+)
MSAAGKSKTEVLADLGVQSFKTGDTDRAIGFFEQALALVEKEEKFNTLHPTILINLGVAQGVKGDMALSAETLEKAVAIQERELGPDAPELVGPLQNLIVVHTKLGDVTKAAQYMNRAGEIEAKAKKAASNKKSAATKPNDGPKVEEVADDDAPPPLEG